MVRIPAGILAFILAFAFGLQAAQAERWLRIIEKDPNRGGKFGWFDVDSIVSDKTSGLILVHSAVLTVKAVRAGSISSWHLWGVDCKGAKAYRIGASTKGVFAKAADWQTDPKAVIALTATPSDRVVAALGAKVCAWSDAWPAGAMP